MLKPLGPLVALGTGDPAGVRSVLRKIGVDRLTLVPEDGGAWWFKGPADFSALVHERVKAAPPIAPHRSPSPDVSRTRCPGKAGAPTPSIYRPVALLDFPASS